MISHLSAALVFISVLFAVAAALTYERPARRQARVLGQRVARIRITNRRPEGEQR